VCQCDWLPVVTEVRDDRAGSEVRARANDAVTNVREMRNPGVGEQDAVFHLYAVTDVAVFPRYDAPRTYAFGPIEALRATNAGPR